MFILVIYRSPTGNCDGFFKVISNYIEQEVLCDVISDHDPIFICIKKQRLKPEYVKIKGRTYSKYDKPVLQALIENNNWLEFYSSLNPGEIWDCMQNIIVKHLNVMCPIKYIRIRTNSPYWITQEIVEAINDRNLSNRMARNYNTPAKYCHCQVS